MPQIKRPEGPISMCPLTNKYTIGTSKKVFTIKYNGTCENPNYGTLTNNIDNTFFEGHIINREYKKTGTLYSLEKIKNVNNIH